MSQSEDEDIPVFNINQNIIDQKDENSFIIHMTFPEVLVYSTSWCFNRKINNDKVQEIYDSLQSGYQIPFILHAVYDEKHANPIAKILILDGQHRVEAIRRYIANDIGGTCSYKVWICIYKINNAETSNTSSVVDIFKKINNNRMFSNDELPDTFIMDLINTLCEVALFKKNKVIGMNVNAHSCHSPCIHKKELNTLFNQHKDYIRSTDLSITELVKNILIINHKLSMKSFEQLYLPKYRNSDIDKKKYQKAVSIKFFLNLKNSQFSPDVWIKHIHSPDDV